MIYLVIGLFVAIAVGAFLRQQSASTNNQNGQTDNAVNSESLDLPAVEVDDDDEGNPDDDVDEVEEEEEEEEGEEEDDDEEGCSFNSFSTVLLILSISVM